MSVENSLLAGFDSHQTNKRLGQLLKSTGILGCPLSTYIKATFASIKYVRRHMFLKELVSWLKKGQIVPFLREKRPFRKVTPKLAPISAP
jgi:hypothetical protein